MLSARLAIDTYQTLVKNRAENSKYSVFLTTVLILVSSKLVTITQRFQVIFDQVSLQPPEAICNL